MTERWNWRFLSVFQVQVDQGANFVKSFHAPQAMYSTLLTCAPQQHGTGVIALSLEG